MLVTDAVSRFSDERLADQQRIRVTMVTVEDVRTTSNASLSSTAVSSEREKVSLMTDGTYSMARLRRPRRQRGR